MHHEQARRRAANTLARMNMHVYDDTEYNRGKTLFFFRRQEQYVEWNVRSDDDGNDG